MYNYVELGICICRYIYRKLVTLNDVNIYMCFCTKFHRHSGRTTQVSDTGSVLRRNNYSVT